MCIVFSHDIVNEIDNNKAPLELTFPEEGTGYEIGAQAILKGAKHMDLAQEVVRLGAHPRGAGAGPEVQGVPGADRQGRRALASRAAPGQPDRLRLRLGRQEQEGVRRQVHQRDRRGRPTEVITALLATEVTESVAGNRNLVFPEIPLLSLWPLMADPPLPSSRTSMAVTTPDSQLRTASGGGFRSNLVRRAPRIRPDRARSGAADQPALLRPLPLHLRRFSAFSGARATASSTHRPSSRA